MFIEKKSKKHLLRRSFAVFMSLCIVIGFWPVSTQIFGDKSNEVSAETKLTATPDIKIEAGADTAFHPGNASGGPDYLYYGEYDLTDDGKANPTPMKWRVLDNELNGIFRDGEEDGIFLLSDSTLGKRVIFNPLDGNSDWVGSSLEKYMETLYTSSMFSDKERANIFSTDKSETDIVEHTGDYYVLKPSKLAKNHLFAPSALEMTNAKYGFGSANTKDKNRISSDQTIWWTRSSVRASDVYMTVGDETGELRYASVWIRYPTGLTAVEKLAARPAMNLNTADVLFTSAATAKDGGKPVNDDSQTSPAITGNLGKALETGTGTEKKLTLIDEKQTLESAEITQGDLGSAPNADPDDDKTITISYKGATTGKNQYLSAAVYGAKGSDNEGKLLYYGTVADLADAKAANGETEFTLPKDYDYSTMTISVFTEQLNGDCKTDYASKPVQLKTTFKLSKDISEETQMTGGITIVPGKAGSSLDNVTAGAQVTIDGLSVKDEYKNTKKLQIIIKGTDNDMTVPCMQVGTTGKYQFTMPFYSAAITLRAVDKNERIISAKSGNDDYAQYIKSVGLSNNIAHGGEKLTVNATASNGKYYIDSISVFNTTTDDTKTTESPARVFHGNTTNTYVFEDADKDTATFTIPEGKDDLLIKVNVKPKPEYTIVIDSRSMPDQAKLTVDNENFKKNGSGNWEASYIPGQHAVIKIDSDEPYMGFSFDEINVHSQNTKPTPKVDTADNNNNGIFKSTYSFSLPSFTRTDKTDATYTVQISPKELYHPYTVNTVTPDSAEYNTVTKLTVSGERLGQIFGKDKLDLLENADQKAAIKKITLGFSEDPAENVNIALDEETMLSADHNTITVPISDETKKALDAKNPDHKKSDYFLTVGTHASGVNIVYDKKLRTEPFDLLAVLAKDENYSLTTGDSMDEINTEAKSKNATVLLTTKGSVKYDKASKTYKYTGDASLDGMISYTAANNCRMSIKENDGTVTLTANGGSLNIPNLKLFGNDTAKNDMLKLELKKGTEYTTEEVTDDDDSKKNLTINWSADDNISYNDLKFLFFNAKTDGVTLLNEKVALKGEMTVRSPLCFKSASLFTADFDKLTYTIKDGRSTFDGMIVDANAKVGLDMIPGVYMQGGSINASINTYDEIYKLGGEFYTGTVEAHGSIEFKPLKDQSLAPNSLDFFIAGDPGVEIIPGLISVTGGGGGFSGLVDTEKGDWKVLPPITVNLQTRVSCLEILNIDAKGTIGPRELSVSGSSSIGKGPILVNFRDMHMGFYATDDQVTANGGSDLKVINGFEFISGSDNIYGGYNWTDKKPILGGDVSGNVQIPKIDLGLFTVGPYSLAGFKAGISTSNIYGSIKVLKFINIGVKYIWGEKNVHFGKASNAQLVGGSYSGMKANSKDLTLKDSAPERKVVSLNGLNEGSVISAISSREDLTAEYYDSSKDKWVKYSLNYPRTTAATASEPYTADELNMSEVNAFDTLKDGENVISFAPDLSLSDQWRLTGKSGEELEWSAAEFEPIEKINSAKHDVEKKEISYDLDNIDANDSYRLDLYATPADGSSGQILLTSKNISTENKEGDAKGTIQYTSSEPSTLPSGDYELSLALSSPANNADNDEAIVCDTHDVKNVVKYDNPLMPGKVSDLTVTDNGDETLGVSFKGTKNKKDTDIGYSIRVYDENKNPVYRQNNGELEFPNYDGSTDTIDQDQVQYEYNVAPSMIDKDGNCKAALSNLNPGKKYIIEVTPYATFAPAAANAGKNSDEKKITYPVEGISTMSTDSADADNGAVEMKSADYPNVSISAEGAETAKDGMGTMNIYSRGEYKINVSADQDCTFEIFTEDENNDGKKAALKTNAASKDASFEMKQKGDGTVQRVTVVATNNNGTQGYLSYIAYTDKTSPELYIESRDDTSVIGTKDGSYTIVGHTEAGASATLIGDDSKTTALEILGATVDKTIKADENGMFKISGKLPAKVNKKLVTVTVSDSLGNVQNASIYVKRGHAVKATASKGGYVKGSGNYNDNGTATLKAVPKKGYRFVKWTEGSAKKSSKSTYSFKVTKDRTLKAVFAKIGKAKLKAKAVNRSKIKLSWKKVTGTYKYELYRSTKAGSKYKKIASVKGSRASYTSSKLKSGKRYYYKVKVVCKAGNTTTKGAFSKAVSTKTK